jgi:hypothetical protein
VTLGTLNNTFFCIIKDVPTSGDMDSKYRRTCRFHLGNNGRYHDNGVFFRILKLATFIDWQVLYRSSSMTNTWIDFHLHGDCVRLSIKIVSVAAMFLGRDLLTLASHPKLKDQTSPQWPMKWKFWTRIKDFGHQRFSGFRSTYRKHATRSVNLWRFNRRT